MASPDEPEPREERYEIRSKLGQGGIGAVYRAYDRTLKREVAIKRLLPQGDKPEKERYDAEEIVREAGALSKLQHPNIVTVYDAGIDGDGGFVVMELIDGETVDVTLSRGALAYDDFRSFVEQALEGLIAAQDIDMLHRDLKPSNVMIRWLPSGKFQLKLLDFGLARVTQKPALQTVRHGDAILGSIYFMAPEQFEREPLDGRTDLYSLGCLFYYMLAGRYPFDGETGGQVMVKKLEHDIEHLSGTRPDIPRPVCDWVMRMLARERGDRPETAQVALREFDAAALQAEEQLAAEKRNPLLAPALAGAGTPRIVTGPVPQTAAAMGTSPLHTTSHYMQKPGGAKSRNAGVALATAASVLLVCGGIGWFLFSQKGTADEVEDTAKLPEETERFPDDNADDPPEGTAEPSSPVAAEEPLAKPVDAAEWPAENLTTLIATDAEWRYWDKGDVPSNTWRLPEFDDSAWESGPAPLGYGEAKGVHRTQIGYGGNPDKKHITYLFRHRFDAPGAKQYHALWLRFHVDDGCIVYLNNKEICRLGMGDKTWPAPSQLAERTAEQRGGGETEFHYFKLDKISRLTEQGNAIAVRVHQRSLSSSDLGIGLEFVAERR